MSGPVFAAVVVIVLVAFAGGYVWGWLNRSSSVEHPDGPETCRAKLRAAERTAATYKSRVWQLEAQMQQLEHDVTASTEILLSEIDKALGDAGHDTAAAGSVQ